jgi:hypothetical protein
VTESSLSDEALQKTETYMKQYQLLAEKWIDGIQKFAGDIVHMVEAEAKYLMHVLEEVVAKAEAPAAAPAADPVAPAEPAPVIGASVQEHPAESNGRRRRQ